MSEIIDTHAHLEEIEDLAGALKRARASGVVAVIAVGSELASNQAVLKIVETYSSTQGYPAIFAALGMHPGNLAAAEFSVTFKLIEDNIERLVAIGEIGLDFWYKPARKEGPKRNLQIEVFQKQLDIAERYKKPVIIHSRGAWENCLKMLLERKAEKALFYCYSGPENILRQILQSDYFISAAPSAAYSKEHRQAIKLTALEKLLIETDSPVVYQSVSGKYRSQSKDVIRTLSAVAEIKGISEAAVAEQTTENAKQFFDGIGKHIADTTARSFTTH